MTPTLVWTTSQAYPEAVTLPEQLPKHSVSVAAAIIDDQGRFLAIRRADNGRWEPPGGVLELHESIEEGLIREVEEETGLQITPLALTGVYKNIARGIIALVFRCEILSGEIGGSVEVADLCWLSADDVRRKMTDAYAVRVLDALRHGPPQLRTHDGASVLNDRA